MSDDKLAKITAVVSIEGAEFEVELSKQVPSALAALFPTTSIRSTARRGIAGHIFGKIKDSQPLDDADIEYLGNILKPAEAKWIKQKAIMERAAQIVEQAPSKAELPPHEESEGPSTSEDWLAKFWDDAGLVSDELLREIYARILTAQASAPGSCSIRTLKAIRYLDPKTAKLFAKIIPLVYSSSWIPSDAELLKKYDINYPMLMELDDAELLQISGIYHKHDKDIVHYFWGDRVIRIENAKDMTIYLYSLTLAGRELSQVAEVSRNPSYLNDTVQMLKKYKPEARISTASRPDDVTEASLEKLSWTSL